MKSRVAHFVSGAVAAALAVSGFTASAPKAEEEVLNLIAKRENAVGLDFTTIPASMMMFIVSGPLLDAADPQKKLGQGKTTCTFTDFSLADIPPAAGADSRSVYALDQGEIHMSSSRRYYLDLSGIHFQETKLAITGGTGEYRTARGDAGSSFRKSATDGISYAVDIRLVRD